MKKTNDVLLNPALIFGVGLFPLIVASASFKSALIYGVLIFLTMTLSQLLIGAFRLIIAKRVRFICYTLAILAVVYMLDSAVCELFPKHYSSIHGMVVCLLASSVVIYGLEVASKEESSGNGIKLVLRMATSYALSVIGVGLVREILSFGTIWGKKIITGFDGLEFFATFAGALFIVLIVALIYNSIAIILRRRRKLYANLVERYGAVIEKNKMQIEKIEKAEGNV